MSSVEAMMFRSLSTKSCHNLDSNSTSSSCEKTLSRTSSNKARFCKFRPRVRGLIRFGSGKGHQRGTSYPASKDVVHQRGIVRRAVSLTSSTTSTTISTWRSKRAGIVGGGYSLILEEKVAAAAPRKSYNSDKHRAGQAITAVATTSISRNIKNNLKLRNQKTSLRGFVKLIMGLLSARSSTSSTSSSILDSAPFGEIDNIMELPDSYVHSDLELLETGRFSDFTIQCKTRTWRVHSLIVCSRSEWFDQALSKECNESGNRTVTVPETEPDDIDSLLLFLYSGDFTLTKWAKAANLYTSACQAIYLADHFSISLLKRPALKQIAIQTKHRIPADPSERKIMEAIKLEYTGPNLPQRALRQMFLLEAVRSRGRYRGPKFQGIFADQSLGEEKGLVRFREQVKKLETVLLENEGGDEHAVARFLRLNYTFVSEEESHARWLRDFPPQGRVL